MLRIIMYMKILYLLKNLTEEEVAAKIDETMQDVSADNEVAKEDKEIVINNDKKK